MIPALYFQVLQAVVIQDMVVDTLTGCTFTAYNITFRSENNVNIWAAEGIELSAKRVTIHTPKELNIVRAPEH